MHTTLEIFPLHLHFRAWSLKEVARIDHQDACDRNGIDSGFRFLDPLVGHGERHLDEL